MKKLILPGALLCALLTLSACVGVPATTIHVTKNPNGVVTYVIESPKQVELEGLNVDEQTGHVTISKLRSVNDATIISSQGQVNVDYLHEVRGLVGDVGALAIQGTEKAFTGGALPLPAPAPVAPKAMPRLPRNAPPRGTNTLNRTAPQTLK